MMKRLKFTTVEEALSCGFKLWTPKNHKDFCEVLGEDQIKKYFYRLYKD